MSQPKKIKREINLDKITPFLKNPADPNNQKTLLDELLDIIFSLEEEGLGRDEISQYIEHNFEPLLSQFIVTPQAIEYLETLISFACDFFGTESFDRGESAYMMLLSMFLLTMLKNEPKKGNKILIPEVKEFALKKIQDTNLQKFKKLIVRLKKKIPMKEVDVKEVDVDVNDLLNILDILTEKNPKLAMYFNRLLLEIYYIEYKTLTKKEELEELEVLLDVLPSKLKYIFAVVNSKSVYKDSTNAEQFKDLLLGMNDCLKIKPENYIKAITIIAYFCNFISDPEDLKDDDQQRTFVDNAKYIGLGEKIKSIIQKLLSLLPSIKFNP